MSGVIELAPTDSRVQRRDLLLGPIAGTVRGIVIGSLRGAAGFPYRDARVTLEDLRQVRSDTAGRFIIRNAPLGTRQLEITAIGMMPMFVAVDVVPNDTVFVDAQLQRVVATLDPVKVTAAARVAAFNRGLEERRRAGFGRIMDSTMIAPIGTLASVFAGAPSATLVRGRSDYDFTVLFVDGSRKCTATVFLDGRRSDFNEIRDISPRDIAIVETYPQRLSVPAEFTLGGLRQLCGVVALWRKPAVRP